MTEPICIFISYLRKNQFFDEALDQRFTRWCWSFWWDRKLPGFFTHWKTLLGVFAVLIGYTLTSKIDWNASASSNDLAQAEPNKVESSIQHVAPFTSSDFVEIRAGTFKMGSDGPASYEDEQPVHEVIISKRFLMSKTEVTQAQWFEVIGNWPSHFHGDDLPVESVSWDDVQAFIDSLNVTCTGCYRLPTEAEWEYAARAGSDAAYSFGNNENKLSTYAWFDEDNIHPVGKKEPNAWGLYDMHGNVWEWVQDWYDNYESDVLVDPTGPLSGSVRVFRGGSWGNSARSLRSADRHSGAPFFYNYAVGFRLVRVAL